MRFRILIWLLPALLLASTAEGRQKKQQTGKARKERRPEVPASQGFSPRASEFRSSQHVYFPDYYAFYDPNRGFVFWNAESRSWQSSLEPPIFLKEVDMSHTRIQILKGLSLDLHPERNYPNYMKLYPAREADPKVPVPNGRQQPGK